MLLVLFRQFLSNPGKDHRQATKWILSYLRGTSNVCLSFGGDNHVLHEYTSTNMSDGIDSKKSTLGYMMTFVGGGVLEIKIIKVCYFINY